MYKNGFESVKRWLPLLALGSVCAYISTISFQLGYYAAYGVDLFLVNPRVDPTSLSAVVITFGFILFVVAETALLRRIGRISTVRGAVISDISFIGISLGTYLVYQLNILNAKIRLAEDGAMSEWTLHLIPIILLILYVARAGLMVILIKRDGKSLRDSYINTTILKPQPLEKKPSKKARQVIFWTGIALMAGIIFVAAPAVTGVSFAESRTVFTQLDGGSKSGKRDIVIGFSANGYILKQYDDKTKKFDDGWQITNQDTMDLKTVKLNPLKPRK